MADFDDVVKQIEGSEKNVDKVLKAARLQRYEKSNIDAEFFIIPAFMIFALATLALLIFFS